jgi:hypothetical protein
MKKIIVLVVLLVGLSLSATTPTTPKVTWPYFGVHLTHNKNAYVTWTTPSVNADFYRIYLYNWREDYAVVVGEVDPYLGVYKWHVPNVVGSDYQMVFYGITVDDDGFEELTGWFYGNYFIIQ